MITREKFKYSVTLIGSDGTSKETQIETYWSPEKEGTPEMVANCAAAMESARARSKNLETRFTPAAQATLLAA